MSMMRRFPAVGLACGILGLSGCLGVPAPVAPVPTPVDSTLILRLREELAPGGRSLFLDCRTSTIFGCFNYRVDHRVAFEGQTIWIEFTGVSIGPICATALGPATARIPLGNLAAGTYDLLLTVRGQALVSELVVTPEAFAVSPARGPWTAFEEPVLSRVPAGTIWGLVGYDVVTKEPLVVSYLDALRAAGATSGAFTPGDYGYFRVNAAGNIEFPEGHGYYFARGYLYRFGGDTSVFPGVIGGFADSLSISLYTDRGERHLSWYPIPAAAMPASE